MYSHCQNYYMVNMTMRPKMALWYLQITEKITTNWRIPIWSEFLRRIKLRRLFQPWQPFIPFALHLSKAMEAASSGYFHSSAQIKVIKNILCPLNLWSRSRKSILTFTPSVNQSFSKVLLTEPRWPLQPKGTQWFLRIGLFVVRAISLGPCRRPIEYLTS